MRMLDGNLSLLAKPASSSRVAMHFASLLVIMLELYSDGKKNLFGYEILPLQISVLISHQKNQEEKNKWSQLGLNLHCQFHIPVALWSLNEHVSFIMATQVISVSPEHSPSDPVLKEMIPLKSRFKLKSGPSTLRGNAYEKER